MTYLLTITLCVLTGDGLASCDTRTDQLRADRDACEALRQPMQDRVESDAQAAGMQVLYLATRCPAGLDT